MLHVLYHDNDLYPTLYAWTLPTPSVLAWHRRIYVESIARAASGAGVPREIQSAPSVSQVNSGFD